MKGKVLLVLLIGFVNLLIGQDFIIVGESTICTSPHEYEYSVATTEVGYSYEWFLLDYKMGEGEEVSFKVANASSLKLVLVAKKGDEEKVIEQFLEVIQTPVIVLEEEIVLCPESDNTIVSFEKHGLEALLITWRKNGEKLSEYNADLVVSEGGTYQVLYDNQGCYSEIGTIDVVEMEVEFPVQEVFTTIDEPFTLELESSLFEDFDVSSLGKESEESLVNVGNRFLAIESDEYQIQLISKDKTCSFWLENSVDVTVQGEVTFSNAFTPNGDGVNDKWVLDGINDYKDSKITILSRWNMVVYQGYGVNMTTWDGTFNGERVPVGIYYFVIELNDRSAKTLSGDISIFY